MTAEHRDQGIPPASPSSSREPDGIVKLQVVGITIVGAVAVICYVLSLLLEGEITNTLRTIAYIAAGISALIGVSFAITGMMKR